MVYLFYLGFNFNSNNGLYVTTGYEGGSPLKEGPRFGIIIGLLWYLPFNVIMIGVVGKSGTLVVVDGLWRLVEQ